MDPREACLQLRQRLDEMEGVVSDARSAQFREWELKTRLTLERALGGDHVLVHQFVAIDFVPRASSGMSAARPNGVNAATGILNAALFELEVLAEESNVAEPDTVDPELFEHATCCSSLGVR